MNKIDLYVKKFNLLQQQNASFEELNQISNIILELTMDLYSKNIQALINRRYLISEYEKNKFNLLNDLFKCKTDIKLLDCGFGGGRDIIYAKQLGFDVYGVEINKLLYNNFLDLHYIEPEKISNCDLRNLPFQDNFFHIVRHNASLVHMPIIGKGYSINKCLEESHRVLKDNGYLYLLMKEGSGFSSCDTLEGYGSRPFIFISEKSLQKLLDETGFQPTLINHHCRIRNGKQILWIETLAKKI